MQSLTSLIRRVSLAIMVVVALASIMSGVRPTQAVSATIVISQVYGGAGCGTAGCSTYKNDYIELFNRGTAAQSVNGWSVQYAAATGTSWQITNLPNVSIPAGGYLLVGEGAGANGVNNLPTPDVSGAIAMSATAAKVALVNGTTALSGGCPTGPSIVDFVGYGTANCFEGSAAAPAPSTTTADIRNASGCTDTDANSTDFTATTPNPRTTATALNLCDTSTPTPPSTETNTPVGDTPTPTNTPTSSPTPPITTHIYDIQSASHRSSLEGQLITNVPGIVTAKRSNGFYMQDASGDGNDATSDGIFVFTNSAPTVSVGDAVLVGGTVQEFRPSGSTSTNLTTTEIGSPSISVTSSGNPLPAATIIGTGGRIPPTTVIEDDATGDVETSGVFDPVNDGIDFYESLEGMYVQVNNAVVVGPTSDFGSNREIPIVGDNGANAGLRTSRGGIIVQPNDFNPERIILNDLIAGGPTMPSANVNDTFPGAITGVIDYSFGNFKLQVISLPGIVSGGLTPEAASPAGTDQLAVATFNVENLDPADGAAKFNTLAGLIVNNLKAPDIIAVEEVQDNNGPTNDSIVDATTTYNTLITAIQSAGGPTYQFRQIDPVDDQDGGEPGGNIRQGFLFRTDRGVSFVDRPGAGSTTSNSVQNVGGVPQLQYSPGRIDPTNSAFNASRKPLAGEFMYNGHHLFVIANHFNSKGGDQPLFGHFQPPTRSSEVQRHQQAQIVNDFVGAILAVDRNANIVVAGDLNDFEFSDTVTILKGGVLNDLIETLPANERYSYVFEGNSQSLDHILVSNSLLPVAALDEVHVNAEFAVQASDHDPSVVHFDLPTMTPTSTPTDTPVPPTDTPTNTPIPPTDTPTNTPIPPTNTPTNTPVPPTNTPTNTPTPSNTPPVANADSATVKRGKSVTINVLANDTDAEHNSLAIISVSPAAQGSVTISSNNRVTYTASKTFIGTDTFTYTISDGHGGTATGTVTVTVTK